MRNSGPVRIDENGVYTRSILRQEVTDRLGIDVDTFLQRLKPKKVFRKAWLGSDILDAWRAAPGLEHQLKTMMPHAYTKRRNLKRKEKGGVSKGFTPEEIGVFEK